MHVCCFTFCVHYPFCSAVKTDWKHLVHSSSSSVKSRASNCPLDGIAAAGLVCQRPWRLNSWATCSAIIPSFLLLGHSSFYLPLFNLAPPPAPPFLMCVCAHGGLCLCQPSVKVKHSTLTWRKDDENQGEEADIHLSQSCADRHSHRWAARPMMSHVNKPAGLKDTEQDWTWCSLKVWTIWNHSVVKIPRLTNCKYFYMPFIWYYYMIFYLCSFCCH